MRRTRLTIASLSMAASAMVLGIPAATAATVSHQADNTQVTVAADHTDQNNAAASKHRRHRREHRKVRIRRHHHLFWHHRCGPGWDSGSVRGDDRDRFRDRDKEDRGKKDKHRRERDRDFRDNGDRGWGRGWVSTCDWHRGHRGHRTEYAAPMGAVRAGAGGSVTGIGMPEMAAGGALAALGLAGAVGAVRRRSSSH
jgi:hypothetical protein